MGSDDVNENNWWTLHWPDNHLSDKILFVSLYFGQTEKADRLLYMLCQRELGVLSGSASVKIPNVILNYCLDRKYIQNK